MEFWIPKGANRFHFTGGARFVHGGAMLQEIVVPVITVKHVEGQGGEGKTQTKQVTVQVLGNKHKITHAKHRFNLIQMEPVSERAKADHAEGRRLRRRRAGDQHRDRDLRQYVQQISMIDRQSVILTLQDRQYDKHTPYRLVLRDADTGIEQQSVDVIIDRAIADDFDF